MVFLSFSDDLSPLRTSSCSVRSYRGKKLSRFSSSELGVSTLGRLSGQLPGGPVAMMLSAHATLGKEVSHLARQLFWSGSRETAWRVIGDWVERCSNGAFIR